MIDKKDAVELDCIYKKLKERKISKNYDSLLQEYEYLLSENNQLNKKVVDQKDVQSSKLYKKKIEKFIQGHHYVANEKLEKDIDDLYKLCCEKKKVKFNTSAVFIFIIVIGAVFGNFFARKLERTQFFEDYF